MSTKKDFNPITDSRLVHKDFDVNLSANEQRDLHQQNKQELIAEFRKNFNVLGNVTKTQLLSNAPDNNDWYYSISEAKGSTMIMFAKWPIGLSCKYNQDYPKDYKSYVETAYFNPTERMWFKKHNDPIDYLELITAKESFVKCYSAQYKKIPNFFEWSLKIEANNITYTNGTDTYICNKGIGGDKYTFCVCEQK